MDARVRARTPSATPPFAQARDRAGRGCVHYAARGGHVGVLEALVAAGADVGAVDKDARGGLFYAARHGQAEACAWLLQKGASQAQDVHGLSPLHMAVLARSAACCALLLRHGANVCAKDLNGLTPYKLAKRFLSPVCYYESRLVLLALQEHIAGLGQAVREEAGLTAARLPLLQHAKPEKAGALAREGAL